VKLKWNKGLSRVPVDSFGQKARKSYLFWQVVTISTSLPVLISYLGVTLLLIFAVDAKKSP